MRIRAHLETARTGAYLGQVGEHRGNVAAQDGVLGFPLLFRLELREEADFARGEQPRWEPIAIEHAIAGERRQRGPRA